jgi:hypothetical protein
MRKTFVTCLCFCGPGCCRCGCCRRRLGVAACLQNGWAFASASLGWFSAESLRAPLDLTSRAVGGLSDGWSSVAGALAAAASDPAAAAAGAVSFGASASAVFVAAASGSGGGGGGNSPHATPITRQKYTDVYQLGRQVFSKTECLMGAETLREWGWSVAIEEREPRNSCRVVNGHTRSLRSVCNLLTLGGQRSLLDRVFGAEERRAGHGLRHQGKS